MEMQFTAIINIGFDEYQYPAITATAKFDFDFILIENAFFRDFTQNDECRGF